MSRPDRGLRIATACNACGRLLVNISGRISCKSLPEGHIRIRGSGVIAVTDLSATSASNSQEKGTRQSESSAT